MQASLKAVLLACALTLSASSYGFDCCGFFGYGDPPCGCGNANCCDGCEPDRWIEADCGCEASCGCEPSCGCSEASCGCSGAYCVDGRKFAGRTYNCGCESYMPTRGCTGSACGDCCEPGCGCETSGGCGDCCEPSCGCGSGCRPESDCCGSGLFAACGRMCSALCGGGSCGCSGEVYWSEWHNDPPRCSDPCNRCGQWDGPGASRGGYGGNGNGYYSGNRPTGARSSATIASGQRTRQTATGSNVARTPPTKARTGRRPPQSTNQQLHR